MAGQQQVGACAGAVDHDTATADPGLVDGVRRIAVLSCNALGDYLMAAPALEALAAAYPQAELILLGANWHTEFLTGRPGPVGRVMVLPVVPGLAGQPAGAPPASGLDGFLAAARTERFDLAVQLHGGGARRTRWLRPSAPGSRRAFVRTTRRHWTAAYPTATTSPRWPGT